MELVLNVSLPNGKRSVRMLCVKERVIESTENHRPVEKNSQMHKLIVYTRRRLEASILVDSRGRLSGPQGFSCGWKGLGTTRGSMVGTD